MEGAAAWGKQDPALGQAWEAPPPRLLSGCPSHVILVYLLYIKSFTNKQITYLDVSKIIDIQKATMFLSLPLPVRGMGMYEVRTQDHGVGQEPGKGQGRGRSTGEDSLTGPWVRQ